MLGFTFSVVHSMGFHRCLVTYIYPEYRTERCHCPHITLRSTYSSLPASSTPQATTDLFYCIYSFPRYSYSYHTWNCIYCTTLVWQAGVSGGLPWTQGPCWAVPHPGAQCLTRLPAVPLLTQHHPASLREPWPAVPSASDQAFLTPEIPPAKDPSQLVRDTREWGRAGTLQELRPLPALFIPRVSRTELDLKPRYSC